MQKPTPNTGILGTLVFTLFERFSSPSFAVGKIIMAKMCVVVSH